MGLVWTWVKDSFDILNVCICNLYILGTIDSVGVLRSGSDGITV